jgi:hypothetical protein
MKGKEMKEKEIPLPFKCEVLENPEIVKNPYSGEEVLLQPKAVAVYDCIKGAEMLSSWKIVRQGLDWFTKYYPKEYYILLD